MASRIYVSNLPPNLKEDAFKEHFSAITPVTDTTFLPKRRMGYIGYKTPELALKAIKYYDKSFIKLSRIQVQIARPADEIQPRKKARIEQPEPSNEDVQTRHEGNNEDPKLKEFLNVMAPSSKSRTWANEDILPVNQSALPSVPTEQEDQAISDDEYQSISKKRKRPQDGDMTNDPEESNQVQKEKSAVISAEAADRADIGTEDLHEAEHPTTDITTVNETARATITNSDADWLRSKTSRVLGLVDDDELDTRSDLAEPAKAHDPSILSETTIPDNIRPGIVHPETEKDGMGDSDQSQDNDSVPIQSGTGRLFLRNLYYGTTEAELEKLFSEHGLIDEVHISKDTRRGVSKGFGYVQFSIPEEADSAKEALDGKSFQGRLLHIIPAKAKRTQGLDEYEISKLPLKKQREIRRKAEASTATFKWNSMYMNPDAVLSSVASRLGVSKTDILDPTSSDSAVKQAHAEMDVIKETKKYFAKHGVDLDAFKSKEYSNDSILVKNFPHGTSAEELKKMFEVYGTVSRLLMPPAATIAIIEMENPSQAKSAFSSLAYRKFKDSVLFLEKAPKSIFKSKAENKPGEDEVQKISAAELLEQEEAALLPLTTSTLFVRNLNFATTSMELRDLFMPLNGFLSATVKTKTDPKKPGQTLSMGFGFVEFRSKQDALSAMTALNGHKLAGHELLIKESNKAIDAAEERRKEDAAKKLAAQRTKIVIRNLPFEASKKDVRALCGPYGQLRTVRVPQKFGGGSRGYAFAEFVTTREAENALKSLAGVHLLGRRLNLDYADSDTLDAEEEIEKMSKKVRKQADKVAVQNLTSGGRKKFSVNQDEDADA